MGSRSGCGCCGSQHHPISHRCSRARPARRCSSGGWSCGCTWCHTLGRCHTRSAAPASNIPMDAAGRWHRARAGFSLLGQPSLSRAERTSSLLWSVTACSGLFPVSEPKCDPGRYRSQRLPMAVPVICVLLPCQSSPGSESTLWGQLEADPILLSCSAPRAHSSSCRRRTCRAT